MKILHITFILLLFSQVMACSFAIGQNIEKHTLTKTYICSSLEFVVEDLEDRFKEFRVGYGVSSREELVQLFVNKTTGRWTIIFTYPNEQQLTCGLIGGFKGFYLETNIPKQKKL